MNLYPTDVKTLSDEELETLSHELSEAFERSDSDSGYWLDDGAETRYYAMRDEKHRRFLLANPDWKPPEVSDVIRTLNEAMAQYLKGSFGIDRLVANARPKIGDTVTVRMPYQLHA